MYTNHPYASPFRGFSHSELSFAIERTMDLLAQKLAMDPLQLRYINAIRPGNTTPTRVPLNKSNLGDLPRCIEKLREIFKWDEGPVKEVNERLIRVKGVACSWKTSTIDPNAPSGAIISFNPDGSINVMSGLVEIGQGTKTILAQIAAEKLKMDVNKIHVRLDVDTQTMPEHWKTVASRGTFMAGKAVLLAAEDVIRQLKETASTVLRAPTEDLEVANSRVFLRDNPSMGVDFKDIGYGYQYPNGNAIGGQIIGVGKYVMRHLTRIDPETGEGKPGPEWTPAAYGVEVEFDRQNYTYRVVKAVTVVDAGKVMNEKMALGQVMGAMSMGIAFAARETFYFDELGRVMNPQLRTYRPLRYGENPEYLVGFVETPQMDAPYGARGIGEQGLMGMPGALGNALSLAAGVPLNHLPLIPELIWKTKGGSR
jgi:CO/xanthine dehydrogenase Mo-binding subunit